MFNANHYFIFFLKKKIKYSDVQLHGDSGTVIPEQSFWNRNYQLCNYVSSRIM
jgi:hypothetical protein